MRVTLNALTSNSGIDPATELYFQLAGVVHLSDPVDPENESHVFLKLISDEQALALNSEINFTVDFIDQTSQLIALYQVRKVFVSLLTLDADRNVVNYSNTFFNT